MMFVVRSWVAICVRKVTWRGRCGGIAFKSWGLGDALQLNVFVIGVHCGHGPLLLDSLADIAWLAKRRPWGSKLLVIGDWNCDMLPSLSGDPWSAIEGRSLHHADTRALHLCFTEALRLHT